MTSEPEKKNFNTIFLRSIFLKFEINYSIVAACSQNTYNFKLRITAILRKYYPIFFLLSSFFRGGGRVFLCVS